MPDPIYQEFDNIEDTINTYGLDVQGGYYLTQDRKLLATAKLGYNFKNAKASDLNANTKAVYLGSRLGSS